MAHLPDVLVLRLLADVSFQPGARPVHFGGPCSDCASWVYKETGDQRRKRRSRSSDRWRNTGGAKGGRDLPLNVPAPLLRRRYGSLTPAAKNVQLLGWIQANAGQIKTRFSYHEYTLLQKGADGGIAEDKTVVLFHILPPKACAEAVPRLGLPKGLSLSDVECTQLEAILRVEGYMHTAQSDTVAQDNRASNLFEHFSVVKLVRLLCDTEFQPGGRPVILDPARSGWVFKESGPQARRGRNSDRWKYSGGLKGGCDVCLDPEQVSAVLRQQEYSLPQAVVTRLKATGAVARRRYGVVFRPGHKVAAFRYHQYTLLSPASGVDNFQSEDPTSPILYHVFPLGAKTRKHAELLNLDSTEVAMQPVPETNQNDVPGEVSAQLISLDLPQIQSIELDILPAANYDASAVPQLHGQLPVAKGRKRRRSAPVAATASAGAKIIKARQSASSKKAYAQPTAAICCASSRTISSQQGLQEAMSWLSWWQQTGVDGVSPKPIKRRTRSSFGSMTSIDSDILPAFSGTSACQI